MQVRRPYLSARAVHVNNVCVCTVTERVPHEYKMVKVVVVVVGRA